MDRVLRVTEKSVLKYLSKHPKSKTVDITKSLVKNYNYLSSSQQYSYIFAMKHLLDRLYVQNKVKTLYRKRGKQERVFWSLVED